MFKIYAYEFTPNIDGNNIAGFVDFLDKNNISCFRSEYIASIFLHEVSRGSLLV